MRALGHVQILEVADNEDGTYTVSYAVPTYATKNVSLEAWYWVGITATHNGSELRARSLKQSQCNMRFPIVFKIGGLVVGHDMHPQALLRRCFPTGRVMCKGCMFRSVDEGPKAELGRSKRTTTCFALPPGIQTPTQLSAHECCHLK